MAFEITKTSDSGTTLSLTSLKRGQWTAPGCSCGECRGRMEYWTEVDLKLANERARSFRVAVVSAWILTGLALFGCAYSLVCLGALGPALFALHVSKKHYRVSLDKLQQLSPPTARALKNPTMRQLTGQPGCNQGSGQPADG